MKNILLFVFVIFCWINSTVSQVWVPLGSSAPSPAKTELIASDITESQLRFRVEGFTKTEVNTPHGTEVIISVGESTPLLRQGFPDIPKLTASVIIPDMDEMQVKVNSFVYADFENIMVAPSKGNFTRDIDPSTVPYLYDRVYGENKFFPSEMAELREPYIVRDYRGQTVVVYPFAYNPVTKTLRVYYDITLSITPAGYPGLNPLIRTQAFTSVDFEFDNIYNTHFLNYSSSKYTPVGEQGKMLIISYGTFMNSMTTFVNWKKLTGMPVEMVDVATIGNSTAIKTYIANYYNTNGLTFVLLVGDAAQVPTSYASGDSDNNYTYIVGNDHYPDIFIGRFSAENQNQVLTQVQRTIDYEQNPYTGSDWLKKSIGIASSQGPGDDNEYDYQHVRNMQTDLLNFTYNWNYEHFDGSQGGHDAAGNPTTAQVSTDINSGSGIILYTGHGSNTSWSSSGFSNSNITALSNNGKLPFIWSVACVNGNFVSTTCFAEAWMRSTNANGAIGAVATLMSTINQSWNPPMEGQDEMVDILVESYANNIKRTFGGLSMNGCMKMNDTYGSGGWSMTDTWTIFGDPSLMVRTDNPQQLNVTHNPVVFLGATQFTVNANAEGAKVALTIDNQILGTGFIQGGTATINFQPLTNTGVMKVTVTAFNYIPYTAEVTITPASGPYISISAFSVNDASGNNNGQLDYGESAGLNISLVNQGTQVANNVNAILSSTDPYITITDNNASFGNIEAGQTVSLNNAFTITAANNIPDNHLISFTLETTSDGSWTSTFSIAAHAAVLAYGGYTISDPSGNNNGKLDPGETVNFFITVNNTGSSDATNVTALLTSADPYITIYSSTMNYGNMVAGGSGIQAFSVKAASNTPAGYMAAFNLAMAANLGITGSGAFTTIVGQIPVLIIDLDPNHNSGTAMQAAIQANGIGVDYTSTFPSNLNLYASAFICLGVYSSNAVLSSAQGQTLATYLTNGGMLYMEGGDTWAYDSPTAVHSMFNITGVADGSGDMGTILGQTSTFTQGMTFTYAGENNWMDHLAPVSPAFTIFMNQSPSYGAAVAYSAATYKTIGASFEFGGLTDGSAPSTKANLMHEYLDFFGLIPPPVPPAPDVSIKVNLEGPFSGTEMNRYLNIYGYLPLSQPYNTAPWFHTGTESVISIPNSDIVDWVLLEFRDAPNASSATSATVIEKEAGFILKNGYIVGMDGANPVKLNAAVTQNLFAIVWHRNHLGVMSANPLILNSGAYNYDFTVSATSAYGGSAAHEQISAGVWGMKGGDGNGDMQISSADKIIVWKAQVGQSGYLSGDYNLSGTVDNADKLQIWYPNAGSSCQVP